MNDLVNKSESDKYIDSKLPTNLEVCLNKKKKFRLKNKFNIDFPYLDLESDLRESIEKNKKAVMQLRPKLCKINNDI